MGDNGAVTETSSDEPAVTTVLVHRVHRGAAPWWSHVVACDVAGSLDDAELSEVAGLLLDLSRAGFGAVLIRPARSDIAVDGSVLADFVTRAHRAGLKVLVRLSGARVPGDPGGDGAGAFTDLEDGASALVVRTRAALKAGADGIDLGIIDEGDALVPRDVAAARAVRFTHLVRILHAELADFDPLPILTAETLLGDDAAFHRHLEEDWFHHLRDDALVTAPWEARVLRERVGRSLSDRDLLGQVAAWHWSHTRVVHDSAHVPEGSWEHGASESRKTAMALYSLTLPGAAYVPFCHLGGRTEPVGRGEAPSDRHHRTWAGSDQAAAEARLLARATRVRAERLMGTGSLAFVDGLAWAPPGVSVHVCAGVMVVLNASDAPVDVPAEHRLLLSSDGTEPVADQPTRIAPEVCAWFETARVQPARVEVHD